MAVSIASYTVIADTTFLRRTRPIPWKVYGPDTNGRFGGLQGTGGLEATILDADGTTTGVINDQFGNGVAAVTGTGSGASVTWNTTRVGAYGPLPGIQAQTLTDVTQLAAATAWRSRRIDPTGFYWLGARYYEPTSGRFLSADPMGHAASPSLYDYAGGDPVNGMDPDGRCASKLAQFMSDPIGNTGLLNDIYADVNAINAFNAQNSGKGSNPYTPPALQDVPTWWNPLTWSLNDWTDASIAAQHGVGDPLGTAAGLVVYTNVPGTVTIGAGAGYAGYLQVGRSENGSYTITGAGGWGVGAELRVSTDSPTNSNVSGPALSFGDVITAEGHAGPIALSGGLSTNNSFDIRGDYSLDVLKFSGQVGLEGTKLSAGGQWGPSVTGNLGDSSSRFSAPFEPQASFGLGGMLFMGVHGGLTFGGGNK
jgi:RHS repeat-associated protein